MSVSNALDLHDVMPNAAAGVWAVNFLLYPPPLDAGLVRNAPYSVSLAPEAPAPRCRGGSLSSQARADACITMRARFDCIFSRETSKTDNRTEAHRWSLCAVCLSSAERYSAVSWS